MCRERFPLVERGRVNRLVYARATAEKMKRSSFAAAVGAIEPTAMERTLKLLNAEAPQVGGVDAPCDRTGSPTG